MRIQSRLSIVLVAVSVAGHAWSQAPGQVPETTFQSAADIAALIARVATARPIGAPMDGAPLLRLAPYQANLEVRAAPGPAAIHEKEAELFVVLDGAGSIITGGKLVAETRRNADNLSGSGITGGVTRKIAKGDVFIVPQNTAHWFNAIDGRLVLMSFHVPRASARDP